jgi:hypothetical protein
MTFSFFHTCIILNVILGEIFPLLFHNKSLLLFFWYQNSINANNQDLYSCIARKVKLLLHLYYYTYYWFPVSLSEC